MDGALCLAPSFLGTLDPACPHCALPFGASAELPLEEWVSWPGLGVKVTQACPTLCHPMAYTVYRILQVRILEWVALPFSRGSSQPTD